MTKPLSFRLPGGTGDRQRNVGGKGRRPTAGDSRGVLPAVSAGTPTDTSVPAASATGTDLAAAQKKPVRGLKRFLPAEFFKESVAGESPAARIARAFNAAQPVATRYALMGRQEELRGLVSAVVDQSRHAIIHGPRGSGKTSLARIFGDLADENGLLAVYNAASEELDFGQLMALFVPYIPELKRVNLREEAEAQGVPLSARFVAGLIVERVRAKTFLIIDEFDRIEDKATKVEMSRLLKLLSDMRSSVRLIIVGIARNVDELIEGHPSLRRAMIAMPVRPIADAAIDEILDEGAGVARIAFSDNAKALLRFLAQGSPYHANLLSLHGALSAVADDARRIYRQHVESGGARAFTEWEATNWETGQFFRSLAKEDQHLRDGLVLFGVLAARNHGVTPETYAAQIKMMTESDFTGEDAERVLDILDPLLVKSEADGALSFEDTLAPQFMLYALTCDIGKADDGSIDPSVLDGYRDVQAVKQ